MSILSLLAVNTSP